MSFFAMDVMIKSAEVSREAGQGICTLCLEYAILVICNQHTLKAQKSSTADSREHCSSGNTMRTPQCTIQGPL